MWRTQGSGDGASWSGLKPGMAFMQLAHGTLSPQTARIKRKALIEYCRRDVVGMVLLLKELNRLVDQKEPSPLSVPRMPVRSLPESRSTTPKALEGARSKNTGGSR